MISEQRAVWRDFVRPLDEGRTEFGNKLIQTLSAWKAKGK
jgi:hypothetical protein